MKKITMNAQELNALIAKAVAEALATTQAPMKGKGKAKANAPMKAKAKAKAPAKGKGNTAPTTRTQAKQAWKDKHNITDETQAEYNRVYEANFDKDWAKWRASKKYASLKGAERSAANKAKAKELRNKYRKQVGITALED